MLSKYLSFANKGAVEHNPILACLYAVALPLALLAKKVRLTPNTVTLWSLIFAALAFFALAISDAILFTVFWLLAYVLDFVDGTLARMTGQVEMSAFDFDHISDILKITIIFLGFGLYFRDDLVWILSFLSSALYVLYTLLNHELNWVRKSKNITKKTQTATKPSPEKSNFPDQFFTIKRNFQLYFLTRPNQKKITQVLITTFTVIHAHTLLIFFLIPLNLYFAYVLLTYFLTLICYQMLDRVLQLKKCSRIDFS
jgi:phosphatidylglycerophosphate synthase